MTILEDLGLVNIQPLVISKTIKTNDPLTFRSNKWLIMFQSKTEINEKVIVKIYKCSGIAKELKKLVNKEDESKGMYRAGQLLRKNYENSNILISLRIIELEEKNLITYSDFNHLNIRRTDG